MTEMTPVAWRTYQGGFVHTSQPDRAAEWGDGAEPLVTLPQAQSLLAERDKRIAELETTVKAREAGLRTQVANHTEALRHAADWKSRAEAAEALLKEAGKVLEPFSEMAGELFARNFEDSDKVVVMQKADRSHVKVTFAHFRAARSILDKIGERHG